MENESSRMINAEEKAMLLARAENLTLVPESEMPQTDEPKKAEKPRVNLVQENLNYLIAKKNLTPAQIQKETLIPWATLQGWCDYSVKTQLLDINIKELADFLEVSVGDLAFVDLRKKEEEEGSEKFINNGRVNE